MLVASCQFVCASSFISVELRVKTQFNSAVKKFRV